MKSVLKEPTDKKYLLILDLKAIQIIGRDANFQKPKQSDMENQILLHFCLTDNQCSSSSVAQKNVEELVCLHGLFTTLW